MDLLFLSRRIYLGDGSHETPLHGGIIVDTEGIIRRVLRTPQEVNTYLYNTESEAVYDFGDLMLMPGLIDANVHINEPGRKDWEGFVTATKSAAAGGFTTIIDRPTNATPTTINVQALKAKTATARGKIYVDVGFWGGLVPGNSDQLLPLLAAGVMGLQCTLCGSAPPVGDEFAAINERQLSEAIKLLNEAAETEALIAFHAELPQQQQQQQPPQTTQSNATESKSYHSFLTTRPPQMELSAIKLICQLAEQQPQRRFHVMNLSCAAALPLLQQSQQRGAQLTAETCPHYLALCAEDIDDCHTEFKTWPPIRERSNQLPLWQALLQPAGGALQLIASDHSAATPGARCLTYGRQRGDFINAWPGISSLQLSLPIVWTRGQQLEQLEERLTLADVHRLMCWEPAKLCGLEKFKGRIAEGYDADFCIWNPDEEFTVSQDAMHAANKSASPYAGQRLRGVVHATVVRGLHVYQQFEGFGQPLGKVLLRKSSRKVVKFVRL
ncbi:LOW QUALITY PROTEIN: allantoinase [Drosophila sulfurigaster albostrigata]|uniref:LOW QUALITY PROTEIN: allantoinase n=1 Tax=Drosophila sulfurigaster albostrigata TaxID=89887 RepID=UPI002D21ECAB|nr:LOW QUALITY PROTEIN: allantoinase [Drosophila sulfurigaster albostrigata]